MYNRAGEKSPALNLNYMTKRYEVSGYAEYLIRVRTEKGLSVAMFTGGCTNIDMPIPASFTTSNVELQKVIEQSADFKRGIVRLVAEEKAEVEEAKDVLADIKSVQAARAYLIETYNVPLEKVQTKSAVMSVAKELGVEFPNI